MKLIKDNGFNVWVKLNEKERQKLGTESNYIEIDRCNKEINLCYDDFTAYKISHYKRDSYYNFLKRLNSLKNKFFIVCWI